jgi:hypothetical protein
MENSQLGWPFSAINIWLRILPLWHAQAPFQLSSIANFGPKKKPTIWCAGIRSRF